MADDRDTGFDDRRMHDAEQMKRLQQVEQATTEVSNMLPPLWHSLYVKCQAEGFTKDESLQLVKTYILTGCKVVP